VAGFLLRNAYVLLFAASLCEQLGAPLPAAPLLLGAGALAKTGSMALPQIIALSVFASMLGHSVWFWAGRKHGGAVLRLICRISIEPDSCVRRVDDLFTAYGLRALLAAKFLPGLNPLAAALAGVAKVHLGRFVLYEAGGALAWSAGWICLGYVFTDLIEQVVAEASRLGGRSLLVLLGLLAGYLGVKYVQRQRFLRSLRTARISPEDLKRRLEEKKETMVVDLRTELDVGAMPYVIPGALRISPDELERRHKEIRRDIEIVLYCT